MLLNNPQYVKVDNVLYKINTDFRIALECNKIANDNSIGDCERALAIIYLLFGNEGLNCINQDKLVELAIKYLSMNEETEQVENNSKSENEFDFIKCKSLISSSFKFDYNYDPYKMDYLHWYDFYNDLRNLSTSEFGNCCVLNRIANIINYDVSKIKDSKEKQNMLKLKKEMVKKYCIEKEENKLTKEQEKSAEEFYKSIMGRR